MFTSLKTTGLGIAMILAAVSAAAVALLQGTDPNWEATATAIMAGIGLIFARDNDTTSEKAGAK